MLGATAPMLDDPVAFYPDSAEHAHAAIEAARATYAAHWSLAPA